MRSPVVSQCIKRLVSPPPDLDQTPFPIIVRTVPRTTSVVPAGCYNSNDSPLFDLRYHDDLERQGAGPRLASRASHAQRASTLSAGDSHLGHVARYPRT